MQSQIIPKTTARILIPFIQLYGLYVIAHGEDGPGGGFQGGVILGASLIIYVLVFSYQQARARISRLTTDLLMSAGALLFAGVGLVCLFYGGNFLEYSVLPLGTPKAASHFGILLVEIGIGITVAAVMITLFFITIKQEEK